MDFPLNWTTLLSSQRVRRESSDEKSPPRKVPDGERRTPFEQDYDRIVFSPPFRRLAKKTQVHPMASNDHIHNRLTHSIEVASVARSFARRVSNLISQSEQLSTEQLTSIDWIVQSACLIHDIGNPPFGHAGEEVIRTWAQKHWDYIFPESLAGHWTAEEEAEIRADWEIFEGNAQGFRIASRRDNPQAGYLRLTYATLGSVVKYPWGSIDAKRLGKRKHNFHSHEKQIFADAFQTLGLVRADGSYCRHPLSFLTEAADDICYRILDLEDAVAMHIFEQKRVHQLLLEITGNQENHWMGLAQLRGQAINQLVDQFWKVFESNYEAIMRGQRQDDLKSSLPDEFKGHLQQVAEMYEEIFGHRKKIVTELGAYHVLGRILKALLKTAESIGNASNYSQLHFLSKNCAELAWSKEYVEQNLDKPHAWWLGQVMDFVSGMTDNYATRLSRELDGLAFEL
ncbi:dNTP triphosphohydrolase [Blastopirellula sp. JC732]|uniref:DNTP triphosphohydrolase n=1 Tax=Blastopirellula sediminis TaxID=2894196 RepID=A0A9X1SGG1_9BACT|nr:dNTP triphosphohydrolase [Blastopirellula sediminis]MCC9607369.1 dNTP triphosphohydrolase [Blastopirellula sediminis]MCC9629338.1 dNTP triphosphohydrolase [Blastopirellula sediminis]